MFSDIVFLKNVKNKKQRKKNKTKQKKFLKNYILLYLDAFIFVSGKSCDSVLIFLIEAS